MINLKKSFHIDLMFLENNVEIAQHERNKKPLLWGSGLQRLELKLIQRLLQIQHRHFSHFQNRYELCTCLILLLHQQ